MHLGPRRLFVTAAMFIAASPVRLVAQEAAKLPPAPLPPLAAEPRPPVPVQVPAEWARPSGSAPPGAAPAPPNRATPDAAAGAGHTPRVSAADRPRPLLDSIELTDAQRAAIKPVAARMSGVVDAVDGRRTAGRPLSDADNTALRAESERSQREIRALLTPAQQSVFDAHLRARRERPVRIGDRLSRPHGVDAAEAKRP